MHYLCCGILGYLIGTFNPSYLLSKLNGFDIRDKGSGNAGATNTLIVLGKAAGVLCALLDISKAYFAIVLAQKLFPLFTHAFAVTGVACILGHIFPFYMAFKGGKGLASLAGTVLAFNWKVFMIMVILELIIVLATNYICFIPITASIALPFIYASITQDLWGAVILFIATFVICLRHVENLQRILSGTEMRIRYLWDPDGELSRIQENAQADDEYVEERFSAK